MSSGHVDERVDHDIESRPSTQGLVKFSLPGSSTSSPGGGVDAAVHNEDAKVRPVSTSSSFSDGATEIDSRPASKIIDKTTPLGGSPSLAEKELASGPHHEPQEIEKAMPPSDSSPSFPDGGKDAWLNVLGGVLISMASVGVINSFSVFEAYYRSTTLTSYSAADIAWIGSLQLWGAFFFGMPAGKLMDMYGPKVPVGIATLSIVFGTMTASISKQYYQFVLSQGLCAGIGYGLAFTPALATPSQWFLKKRGVTTGMVVSGSSIGGVIWPVAINRLLNYDKVSLGWTLRTVGFLQLLLMSAATFLIRSRIPRNSSKQPAPLQLFFKDKRVLLLTFASFVMFLSLYIPFFYITPYGIRWGASTGAAFYYPAIINASSFFGRFLIGMAADRILGFYNAMAIFTCITSFIAFGWIGARSNASNIIWAAFYGFSSGSLQSLVSPCMAPLAPSPALIGTWIGLSMTFLSFAALGSNPIAGRLLDATGARQDYIPLQVFTAVVMLVAGIASILLRIMIKTKAPS